MTDSRTYCTSYCNRAHRVSDGKPVAHECAVLPPRALELEMAGDTLGAVAELERARPMRTMKRGGAGVSPGTPRVGANTR